uniref:T-cell surface antigen CD2 n=1 Tax=Ginglymostoma cirratum TaxID=7801 RepID=V9NIT6_GINCI|nr:T-cell surface antigen CD2 precursor [Ginglymostoma cirratum]
MLCHRKCALYFVVIFLLDISGLFLAENKGKPIDVYGGIGKSVFLHVNHQSSKNDEIKWMKGNTIIARYKDQASKSYATSKDGLKVYANGTLTFKIMDSTEGGTYEYEIYNGDGILTGRNSIKLHLLESVSKPVLDIKCNSRKEVNITCKVENGTNFTMILSGNSLNEMSNYQYLTAVQSLKETEGVKFFCNVSNKISEAGTSSMINCTEPRSIKYYEIMILAGAITLATIVIILVIYCTLRCCKRRRKGVVDTSQEVRMEFRVQMKQPRQPIPDPGQHNEEYSSPQPRRELLKPRERSERMDRGERAQKAARAERAQKAEREERAERAQRADESQRAERPHRAQRAHRAQREQRGENGEKARREERRQRGERTLEGDRLPRTEHKELRANRGPVPLPSQIH